MTKKEIDKLVKDFTVTITGGPEFVPHILTENGQLSELVFTVKLQCSTRISAEEIKQVVSREACAEGNVIRCLDMIVKDAKIWSHKIWSSGQ